MFEIPKAGEQIDTYDGSRAFTWLANMTGLSIDLVSIFYPQLWAYFGLLFCMSTAASAHAHTTKLYVLRVCVCEIHSRYVR